VASIFVNPRQFAAHEDLASYPRDEDQDVAMLAARGCDLVFAPGIDEMYPEGFATVVSVAGVSAPLEGEARPHFFAGVATVVAKLLIQVQPDVAVFGEKDYQQLLVIRRLARDLDLPVEILGGPTLREPDGLAMSSRNRYLTASERARAAVLPSVLAACVEALEAGGRADITLDAARSALAGAGFDPIDYVSVHDAETLAPVGPGPIDRPARVMAAARLGRTRLIDNWPARPPVLVGACSQGPA
jgi:pantoate--beta-alanine ligase